MIETTIAAVIVTHSRLYVLKECIDSVRRQSRKLDEIIVINNSSNDGTIEWLNGQQGLTVITQENSGSAGGQYTGIKTAFEKGHDWIWCMDDDSVPETNALEKLVKTADSTMSHNVGFLASRVLWVDNSPHVMNLPGYFFNKNKWNYIGSDKFNAGVHKIDVCSFVSCLFHKEAVRTVGFPNPLFFVWFDDIEYTSRFHGFDNYYVSSSVTFHKTKTNFGPGLESFGGEFSIKKYYGLRNFYFFYKHWNKFFLVQFSFLFFRKILSSLFERTFVLEDLLMSLSAIVNGLKGNLKGYQARK